MRIAKTSAATALIACSCLAAAEDSAPSYEFSGNVALTSDYVFRGMSQTDNNPAIQGGFDFNHDSGVYAGIWASNVSFAGSIEIDYYVGFANEIGDFGYDFGFLYYDYPSDSESDYIEYLGSLSYDLGFAEVSGGLAYSDDFFAGSGEALYYHLGADVPLPYDIGLAALVGYQDIDDNDTFGTPDYTHWSIGVSREFFGLGFDLSYHDTDLDDDECFGGDNICDTRAVFTISKSL